MMTLLLCWVLALIGTGSHALEVGLIGSCGEQPCVAALESSTIDVEVNGAIATTKLQQVFRGVGKQGSRKMKDTYFVFPIHAGTVVTELVAEVNGRVLKAKVMERREAQKAYEKATESGCSAALSHHGTDSREAADNGMDLYRISLGNIPTRVPTLVNFTFIQELTLQDSDLKNQGFLRLLLPAVVGARSRYGPRSGRSETLLQAATQQLPTVMLRVAVEPAANVSSPSHSKLLSFEDGDRSKTLVRLEMRQWEDISTDFVLHCHHFPPEDNLPDLPSLFRPRVVLEQHPSLKTWAAMAEMVPRFSSDLLTNVEITILVDRSGSMRGTREAFARRSLEHFLRSCPHGALVNVIGFGNVYEKVFESPVRLQDEELELALEHAKNLQANLGGTVLAPPLKHILTRELQDGFYRRVLVLTDGDVWNADEIISVAEHCQENCEIHTLGVGSGVSTALLQRLASKGQGTAHFLADGEEDSMQEVLVTMLSAALQPPVTKLQVHWTSAPQLSQPLADNGTKQFPKQLPEQNDEGIFQHGVLRSLSKTLEENSAEKKQKQREKLRAENIRRFSEQGGFQRPLQVGRVLQPIRSGTRWSAYAFLGLMNETDLPTKLEMTGRIKDRDFSLTLPVVQSAGTTIHALAAWHLSETLGAAGSGPWPELADAHGLGDWEDAHWQIVALGVTFGIATSKTSWIALDEKLKLEDAAPTVHQYSSFSLHDGEFGHQLFQANFNQLGTSMTLRGFSRLGPGVSVLDMMSLGSSLSLRSFGRLGSAFSGMSRLGSTMSVLDLSFSPESLRSFGEMTSSLSIKSFSRLGTSRSALNDVGQMVSTLSLPTLPTPTSSKNLMYICIKLSERVAVPVALIQIANQSNHSMECSLAGLQPNVTPMAAMLKNSTGLGCGAAFPGHLGFVDLGCSSLGSMDTIHVSNCTLQVSSRAPIRLNASELQSQLPLWEGKTWELLPDLEVDPRKWGCPTLPRKAFDALVNSQRENGWHHWPVKFLQHLQGEQNLQDSLEVQEPTLPTLLAIAALRRCFPNQHLEKSDVQMLHLKEWKAVAALLQHGLSPTEIEQSVSFANAVVLQRFMWKVK